MKEKVKFCRVTGTTRDEYLKSFAFHIMSFFHGVRYACEPVEEISLSSFGFHDFDVYWSGNKKNEQLKFVIQLEHVGIIIGKKGELIERLTTHIQKYFDSPISIHLIQTPSIFERYINNKKLPTLQFEKTF